MRRRLITLRRIFIAGFKNFFRNAWLSIAATAVMVVALTNMLSAVVLNVTTNKAVSELSTNLKVSVYIKEASPEQDVLALKQVFDTNEFVAESEYITQEQARENFVNSFQEDAELLEGLALIGGNSLPASLEVGVSDLSKIEEVGAIAQQQQYSAIVDSVSLGKTEVKATLDRAAGAQRFVTIATVITAAIFALVSVLIIFNTIRMAIFTRSDEIRTQKLLGATPGYIRGPFLVESSVYGIVAGIISAGTVYGVVNFLGGKIAGSDELGLVQTYELFGKEPLVIALMFAGSITVGVIIGIISSYIALKRYLKIRHW
jgi:cell division transport system permease protein